MHPCLLFLSLTDPPHKINTCSPFSPTKKCDKLFYINRWQKEMHTACISPVRESEVSAKWKSKENF